MIDKLKAVGRYFVIKRYYETSPFIKQEFISFLEWHKSMQVEQGYLKLDSKQQLEKYLKYKDIALYGDIRKLHGANTRNSTVELYMAIAAAAIGTLLAILIACYFP